jgi:glycine dehydrogenase
MKEFFKERHIGPRRKQYLKMLAEIGLDSLQDLTTKIIPENILDKRLDKLPPEISEVDTIKKLKGFSKQNNVFKSYIGQGYYGTIVPGVIKRNILENPGWYTSYTPYQPEVAQGRLEMLLNFQQMIVDFTGMDIANASLLDEGTAAAEAMGLSHRLNKKDSNLVFVSEDCHPQTINVIQTRAEPMGLKVLVGKEDEVLDQLKEDLVCGILQYPGTLGDIKDPSESISKIHKKNGKAVLACDLYALAKLKTPRELGADIAVGSSQRFGIPMGYGGPHAAFFATKDEYKRSMPGRIIGVSGDRCGKKAYRLSLQTREQHIRRDKATSNICTAQALLAIVSAAYAIYHGPKGILEIANRTSRLAKLFAKNINDANFELHTKYFFDTVTIKTNDRTDEIYKKAIDEKVNLRKVNNTTLSVAFDEAKRLDHVNLLLKIFGIDKGITKTSGVALDNIPNIFKSRLT